MNQRSLRGLNKNHLLYHSIEFLLLILQLIGRYRTVLRRILRKCASISKCSYSPSHQLLLCMFEFLSPEVADD